MGKGGVLTFASTHDVRYPESFLKSHLCNFQSRLTVSIG